MPPPLLSSVGGGAPGRPPARLAPGREQGAGVPGVRWRPTRPRMPAAKAAASAPSSSSPPTPRIPCKAPCVSPPPGNTRSISSTPNGKTPWTASVGRSIRLMRSRSSGRQALSSTMFYFRSHSCCCQRQAALIGSYRHAEAAFDLFPRASPRFRRQHCTRLHRHLWENAMSGNGHLTPEQVHAKVKHPIVDGDGHWVEFPPVFAEKMRKVGGDKAADGFLAPRGAGEGLKMTPAERTGRRIAQPNFWNRQGENTLDRATAMMPKLLYERLDEIGTDFAVIYPTAGLGLPRIKDDETRRAVIRAYNIVSADYFCGFSDRMTPAAVIPMHTPQEAIEELEFVTKQLGSKVGMFGSNLPRPARPPWRRMTNLERMDPAKLDRKLLMDLVIKHGYDD